jgi:short-subunit dehydrogenase
MKIRRFVVITPFQMPTLTDKVVLITGASAGIGRATALAFAREGAVLALVARSEDRLHQLSDDIKQYGNRTEVFPVDVADRDRVFALMDQIMDAFGRIDILVNNAGIGLLSPIVDMKSSDVKRVIDVNLFGLIWCTQAALPHMIRQNRGHIINVSSIAGKRAMPYMSTYCASKFAVQAFSESLRVETAPHNINVSVICPPRVQTEFDQTAMMQQPVGLRVKFQGITAESVASVIVRTARRRYREVIISLPAKCLAFGQKISPRLIDWALARVWTRLARKNQ